MHIDTVVSHGDWYNGWGSWGYPSVLRILSEIKRAGVRKVHWRTSFGARVMYHSAHELPYLGDEAIDRPGNESIARMGYDTRTWDPLRDAVAVARQLSLPLVGWYTPYEESHYQTTTTSLIKKHPEFRWMARDGKLRDSKASFAAPEVRAHKLALIREQLAYGVDGLFLDFFREHHVHAADKNPRVEVDDDGVCIYGYEPVMADAYRKAHGVDPATLRNDDESWLAFRNEQTTQFVREVAEVTRAKGVPLSVKVRSMTPLRTSYWWLPERHKTNSYRGSFVDWPTWSREGLVDEVMLILENWDLMDLSESQVWEETEAARAILGGGTKLNLGFFMNNMRDRSVRDGEWQLERCANSAIRAGADSVCLWESTGIHAWGSVRGGGSGTGIGLWPAVRRLAT